MSQKTRELRKGCIQKVMTREELEELLVDEDTHTLESRPWRHGRSTRFLFLLEGKRYASWLNISNEDGVVFGDHGVLELVEVKSIPKTGVDWVPVYP